MEMMSCAEGDVLTRYTSPYGSTRKSKARPYARTHSCWPASTSHTTERHIPAVGLLLQGREEVACTRKGCYQAQWPIPSARLYA